MIKVLANETLMDQSAHAQPKPQAQLVIDESKTHLFLSQFFEYISGLKVQFNAKLWSFHLDFCLA